MDIIDITSIVLFVILGAAVLAIIQMVLSVRADNEHTTSGPRERLNAILSLIDEKRQELAALEERYEDRQKAFDGLARTAAEVAALEARRDELLREHAQLEERREEVRAVARMTEDAITLLTQAQRDLRDKEEELEGLDHKLERAARLEAQMPALEAERDRLNAELTTMRAETQDLRALREEAGTLRDTVQTMERETARLEGLGQAETTRLEETRARVQEATQSLATRQSEAENAAASLAVATVKLRDADEGLRHAEARKAQLDAAIAEREGRAVGDGDVAAVDADGLKELRDPPEVLRQLAEMEVWVPETEAEALRNVENRLEAHGLTFHRRIVRAFHTAMKVNETTQMAVLAGISGTGKSQLPRQYAAGMGIGFLQVPVQPRWDSPQDLMGFYNYIEKNFRPTDMARALYQLDAFNGPANPALNDRMLMVLLDEMNLARVEYYFSDFLSRLESRPSRDQLADIQLRKDSEIELEIPQKDGSQTPRIFPGYNLFFAGTMNEDESTQTLSDKVVDRANVMRFAAPRQIAAEAAGTREAVQPGALPLSRWQRWLRTPGQLGAAGSDLIGKVNEMAELMRDLGKPFGHRLGRAISAYVSNYPEVDGGLDIRVPLADQVDMRLLPKLRGLDVEMFQAQFGALEEFARATLADDTLADAISASVDKARAETGTFHWQGVIR